MRTRAAVINETGKSGPYSQSRPLIIEEVELDAPGPGEVLVEIAGTGLCHSDLSTITGAILPPKPRKLNNAPVEGPLPLILGHEASGIVREVGPGVTEFKPDDHVVFSFVPVCGQCYYCAIGRPALCKNGGKANLAGTLLGGEVRFHRHGGEPVLHYLGVSSFSEYTVAAQESLIKIDKNVPLDKAALFGCAVITGVGAVLNTAQVQAGAPVAIFGLGGVGLSALMGAKLAGAFPIIVVDTQPSKFELAKKLGADYTINARETNPVAAIREISGGGVEYSFEAVGNASVLAQAYDCTQRGGKTVSIGLAPAGQPLTIAASSLTYQEKTLQGSFMGSAIPRRDIPRLINLYMAGKLPLDELFSQYIPFEEINEAFDRLAEGTTVRQLIKFK
ncbi:MAG TPA: zinc-dependent alcohol dehydrogenase family protein [Chloroflexia bacterium]|nr:zinc-dependent alcohol dehydrogenase family protein [Chloroflexia bacterium]